jgi:hypothetical protein
MNEDKMKMLQAYMQQFTPRYRPEDEPKRPPAQRTSRPAQRTSTPPRPGPGDRDPRPRQRPLPGPGDRDPRPRRQGGNGYVPYVPQSSPGEILGDYGQFIADYPGRVIGQTGDMFKDSANAWLRQIPGINFGPFG